MMSRVSEMANAIYGEAAGENDDGMILVGSSILNRLDSNRPLEFGRDLTEILRKGYYAVSNPNEPYKQAITGKFPDKQSELKYKRALQIANGLVTGKIKRTDGQFYFTDKEIARMKKAKSFDFKQVKDLGKNGKYRVFGY